MHFKKYDPIETKNNLRT